MPRTTGPAYFRWQAWPEYGKKKVPKGLIPGKLPKPDTFTFECTLLADPWLADMEPPLVVSMRAKSCVSWGHCVLIAFTDVARYCWENLISGDRILVEGVLFRKVSPKETRYWKPDNLALRCMKITLVESKLSQEERDALFTQRAFLEPTKSTDE